jgi:hypothetical protein
MFRAHHSHPSSRGFAVFLLAGIITLLSLGALLGPGTSSAQAQEKSFPLGTAVATNTGLNLRDQPNADSAIIVSMPVNARSVIIGGPFNDGWYWLDYNGTRGYAHGKYLVVVDDKWIPLPTETATTVGTPASTGTTTAGATPPAPVTTGEPSATPASGSPTAETTATPDYTAPSAPGEYTGLWLGEMATGGNVRSGPGLNNRVLKGWWAGRRVLLYQSFTDEKGGTWYRVSEPPETPMYVHASLIRKVAPVKFENGRYKGKWVNVNITQQIVTAYEGAKPVKVTLVSTGKASTPTELGTWKIYWRLPKQTMEGGNLAAGDYYRLENVPFPQYFHMSGESFHGTYWHDNFGKRMSHGCVNMTTPMAGWLYGWASIGTPVWVHN